MELTKEAILRKTHYGLNIYAHVLRQYYPGEGVLSLSGRGCHPAANPFNQDKPTLHISIVDNCAVHQDAELEQCRGDAFDFAAAHYGITTGQLYGVLNREMHLRLGEGSSGNGNQEQRQKEIRHQKSSIPVFSYFPAPVSNIIPDYSICLVEVYELVRSEVFASQTATLRTIADKKEARAYKAAHFDYVTFSGLFTRRAENALQKHSGLLTVDLDHIGNPADWIGRLLADEYFETELLFTSPSGDGLKWIIPINLTKATHAAYFKSISNYMRLTYGLKMDTSGSDCSRACFLPHDPNIYINPKYV